MEYYLFTSASEAKSNSPGTVFYKVNGTDVANTLCRLFAREYAGDDSIVAFSAAPVKQFSLEECVLMDESLDALRQYNDPDPGVYDPSPPLTVLERAQCAIRAQKWEDILRLQSPISEPTSEIPLPTTSSSQTLPQMSEEDEREAMLNLLMRFAQVYYRMLEATLGLATFVTYLDLPLNESYFWLVRNLQNLLANVKTLADFPAKFEPLFQDLYPSTIGDVDWDDVRPEVEQFLSAVHRYVSAKSPRELEQGSDAWIFVELFRPALDAAVDKANNYHQRAREYRDAILGSGGRSAEQTEDTKVTKTIVELDLVGYSGISNTMEQGLDVASVAQLNDQIQSFIAFGLKAANTKLERAVVARTGDGAILAFDAPDDAFRFAEAVHRATQEHNRGRDVAVAKRVFRIGAATGDVVIRKKPGGGFDAAGSTIARAVRLESQTEPGSLLVDTSTFDSLSEERKAQFGPKCVVPGKRDEQFEAYPVTLNAQGPDDAALLMPRRRKSRGAQRKKPGTNQRRDVLELLKKIKSSELPDLTFLLEIPLGQRPSDVLTLDQKKQQILNWAEEEDRLTDMIEILQDFDEQS